MTLLTVFGVDPGSTTGWAKMTVDPAGFDPSASSIINYIEEWEQGQIVAGSIATKRTKSSNVVIDTTVESKAVLELITLMFEHNNYCVAVEDFILRKFIQDRDLLAPVRITAALEYHLCCIFGKEVFRISANDAANSCSDERLKDWGFYVPGSRDARSATRVALTFLRKCKDLKNGKAIRKKAWPDIYGK